MQNSLLKNIHVFSEKNFIRVVDFKEPHQISKKDYTIKTSQFSLQGDYQSIITLIHALEQQTVYGEIIHIRFEKKRNYRAYKNYLQAHILLKSIS